MYCMSVNIPFQMLKQEDHSLGQSEPFSEALSQRGKEK